jgi:methyl-accepting chemotaxis protein
VELAQHLDEYRGRGVEAAVVLPQRAEGVRRYLRKAPVPFDVLIDEERKVVREYGVWHRIGLDAWNTARPAVFLIDRDGSIGYSFIGQSQGQFPSHEELMGAI